jgi:hypothetical protein
MASQVNLKVEIRIIKSHVNNFSIQNRIKWQIQLVRGTGRDYNLLFIQVLRLTSHCYQTTLDGFRYLSAWFRPSNPLCMAND